jgi:two-component system OmpR family sensor kinase
VPLRRLLVLSVLASVALATLLIGVITHVVVTENLVRQTDQELERSIQRAADLQPGLFDDDAPDAPDGDGTAGSHAPRFLQGPGQGEYSLAAVFRDGELTQGGWVDASGAVNTLDDADIGVLAEAAGEASSPQTHRLGIGTYRLQSVTARSGDQVVIGVSVEQQEDTVQRLDLTLAVVGLAAVLLATGMGLVLVRRSLRPLATVAEVADEVAAQDLTEGGHRTLARVDPPAERDADEVARVSRALNTMLDHVDEALAARRRNERRMARFVADASHELRTPLTIMNGYLDLLGASGPGTSGARAADVSAPGDAEQGIGEAQALERVRAQTARMTRLVEDLLLLNRLEQAEQPRPVAVALDEVALDAVMDAQTAAPQHRLDADFADLPPEGAMVLTGPGHVERILANLLSNAVKHTPAGTEVVVRLGVDGEHVVLEVADDGPGMDETTREGIFDRFVRADTARTSTGALPVRSAGQDGAAVGAAATGPGESAAARPAAAEGRGQGLAAQSSTGLGMALVQALARSDGGDVEVISSPGHGTRVQVRLPRAR